MRIVVGIVVGIVVVIVVVDIVGIVNVASLSRWSPHGISEEILYRICTLSTCSSIFIIHVVSW
jgi:hypothetical protein